MWLFKAKSQDESPAESSKHLLHNEEENVIPLPTEQSPVIGPTNEEKQSARPNFTGNQYERLSIPLVYRVPFLLSTSFFCGFSLGAAKGSTKAADRFRAENAHRLPRTQSGWYLYAKSKNYHAGVGGIKEGVKFGGVCAGWAGLFMLTEEILDQSRGRIFAKEGEEFDPGQRDAANTVIAALSMAGVYSWKKGLDSYASARTAKMAIRYSLMYGLLQDLAASARGSQPAYISWITNKIWGHPQIEQDNG